MLDTFFQSQSDSFLLRAPREKKFIFAVNWSNIYISLCDTAAQGTLQVHLHAS